MFVNNLWRHYKGGRYFSFGVGFYREELVLYRGLNSVNLWLRPSAMWFEKVNGVSRFTLSTDEDLQTWAVSQSQPTCRDQVILNSQVILNNIVATHTETNELLAVKWIGTGEFKIKKV